MFERVIDIIRKLPKSRKENRASRDVTKNKTEIDENWAKVDNFGKMIGIENFRKNLPWEYIEVILDFANEPIELENVLKQYKDIILQKIFTSAEMKDKIMTEGETIINDKKVEDEIHFAKMLTNVLEKKAGATQYEENFRTIVLLETAKLINVYGLEQLNEFQEMIEKEIKFGIMDIKTDPYASEEEKAERLKRIELSEKFGEESIEYIENYELLLNRTKTLLENAQSTHEIDALSKIIERMQMAQEMMVTYMRY